MIDKKVCTYCKASKSLTEFSLNKRNPDGLNKICIKCCLEYKEKTAERRGKKPAGKIFKAHRAIKQDTTINQSKEREEAILTKKKCRRCGEVKIVSAFPRNKQYEDGRDKMCKTCWKDSKSRFTGKSVVIHKVEELPSDEAEYVKKYKPVLLDSLSGLPNKFYLEEAGRSLSDAVKQFVQKRGSEPARVFLFLGRYYLQTSIGVIVDLVSRKRW
jgi:hypothetical protein